MEKDERAREWQRLEAELQLDLFQDNNERVGAARAKLEALGRTPPRPSSRRRLTRGRACASLKERGDDCYPTPPSATEALLRAEKLPQHLWECCQPSNEPGGIVDPLRERGHTVTATDLRGDRIDFLMEWRAPEGVQGIITNPPYRLADQFVRHALTLVPFVAMLLPLTYLQGERRADLIGKLSRVHAFHDRLPRMHRLGWNGPRLDKEGYAHAWFVWDTAHTGPFRMDCIWCRSPARSAP